MKKFLKLTTMLLASALVSLTLSGCKTDPDKLSAHPLSPVQPSICESDVHSWFSLY